MKKLILCLMSACLTLAFFPMQSISQTAAPSSAIAELKVIAPVATNTQKQELVLTNAPNKATLSSKDKKNLKNSARNSNANNQRNGGVYISVGGLLLVLLLLIILL